MWALPRPDLDTGIVYRACISGVRIPGRRARLAGLEGVVVAAAHVYGSAAASAQLHTLTGLKNQPADPADRAELQNAYTDGLVRRADARPYYDALLARAPYGRCPFCGHRSVATLDHQLPKSAYPLLAITPDNLVPACFDCNHLKSDAVPTSAIAQGLHPYFENGDRGRWLFAQVLSLEPATMIFHAEPDDSFDVTMQARIRQQVVQFRLPTLYSVQAAQHMAGIRGSIGKLRQHDGPSAVQRHLQESAASWAAAISPNCWQRAMYEALAADQDYVHKG